jgi:glycosyltransferase involved in cell wall biosynthesis
VRIVQSFPHPSRDLDTDGSGQTVRARALRDALRAAGHDVVTVSRAGGGGGDRAVVDRYRGGAGRRLLGPVRPAVRDAGRIAYGLRNARRVAEAARDHRADAILETHIAFSLSGARAAAATGVPLVVDDLAPIWEERTFGVGLGPAADAVWRTVTRRARVLVAVNQPIREALLADVDDAGKLVVVGNGWDPGWADAPRRARDDVLGGYDIAPAALVVVFVGSFLPWHRAEALVEALATAGIARPWHLLLLGDGPELPATLAAAARHGVVDRVTATGHLSPDAVGAHLRVADIAALPATNAYGNPMKLVEYLAAGVAVVAPRQATVTELCTHDRTAWLCTPGDTAALGDALRTVAHDDALRRRLAGAAAAAAADLRWDRQADRLVEGMRAAGIGADAAHGLGLPT